MSTELGTGYVSVAMSTGGLRRQIAAEFDSADGDARVAGGRIGTSLGGGMSGAVRAALGVITAVGVGAAVGKTITLGLNRSLSIQDAQQKLTGLGHSAASITEIMNDALASVKGTAYGLGDAATVAASLSASGIVEGSDLTNVLKTVADTAAISGESITQIGAIFGSVAAQGKLHGQDLLQLTQAGVPVLQFLSNQLHVTTADVSDMVTNGQIDFATFAAAMQAGLGGSALASGQTARGALDNVGAAVSRLSAQFTGPLVTAAPGVFNAISAALDKAGPVLKPFTDRFADFVAQTAPKLIAFINNVDLGQMISGFQSLLAASPVLDLLRSVFFALAPVMPMVQAAFMQLAQALAATLAANAPALATAFQQLVAGVVPLLPLLVELVIDVFPLIPPLLNLILQALPPLIAGIKFAADNWADLLRVATGFISFLSGDATFAQLGGQISSLSGPLAQALGGFTRFASGAVQAQAQVLGWWERLPQQVQNAVAGIDKWLVNAGQMLIAGFVGGISGAFKSVETTLRNLFGGAVDLVKTLLGIHSPSTVFRDEVGAMMGAGLAMGLQDSVGQVMSAVSAVNDGVLSSLTTDPVPLSAAISATSTVGRAPAPVAASVASAGSGFPGTITLVDADGSLLGHMRVIASDTVAASGQARKLSLSTGAQRGTV